MAGERSFLLLGLRLAIAGVFLALSSFAADWLYLDNGQIRLGVDRAAGASIGFFGESATSRNLLNHYDKGRFIQQSYYGAKDGSDWNGKPWRWNPVQGGGWRGEPARTLAFTNTATTLYAKTLPKHWATGADLPTVVMEEWLTLTNREAHLRFRMTYRGATNHPAAHQELPAVFVDYALTNLVYYQGAAPWTGTSLTRRVPGWPNEYVKQLTENWAAFVDGRDWGLGVCFPGTAEMTCYRAPGKPGPAGSGCSYLAPIRTLAITNGFTMEYDAFLAIGTVSELRATFKKLSAIRPASAQESKPQ
ncbi:MAG: hypothetical protein EB141_15815 [Verrucomicrobia bacterium]|nr:hypothetical protein [Verrucomicrobiota bacterium]NBU10445.1 hypothetical protein [Pseudomonadota bacterium]NDA67594.1 hypothetical protein [Verrucomicrobiota bacterium]NDB77080.1 hypothetical protein [Verrucomicrobiota bacterium]NDD38078.1 hypothetical protein [Verrucomicrobiota bacterium]